MDKNSRTLSSYIHFLDIHASTTAVRSPLPRGPDKLSISRQDRTQLLSEQLIWFCVFSMVDFDDFSVRLKSKFYYIFTENDCNLFEIHVYAVYRVTIL